jgi:hypothetical protein
LDFCDLIDVDKHLLDNALEKIEETTFDAFNLCTVAPGHGIQFMMYKICYMYNFYSHFNFTIQRMIQFSSEIANGYFQDNPFHNQVHIVDSLQGMHYLFNTGNMRNFFKLSDVFASFIANLIHDYEHPGYTNQFVIRTKHPLAIRYSDI